MPRLSELSRFLRRLAFLLQGLVLPPTDCREQFCDQHMCELLSTEDKEWSNAIVMWHHRQSWTFNLFGSANNGGSPRQGYRSPNCCQYWARVSDEDKKVGRHLVLLYSVHPIKYELYTYNNPKCRMETSKLGGHLVLMYPTYNMNYIQ